MKKNIFENFGRVFRGNGRFEVERFDPETHEAVIRSSICTGEKTAGFLDKKDGHFTEVMLIRTPADLEQFKQEYGVDTVKTIY